MKLFCPQCKMCLQGNDTDREILEGRMQKHVVDEHSNPVEKHIALLTLCYTAFKGIENGVRLNRSDARHCCEKIAELLPHLKGREYVPSATGKTVSDDQDVTAS
jgi:hypothetical protein